MWTRYSPNGPTAADVASFPTSAFLGSLPWLAAGLVVVLAATFAIAKLVGKHSVIDTVWGLLFVTIAVLSFAASSGHGDTTRRWLLLVLTCVWGLRLAVHIGRRNAGKPEDPRYERLLAKARGNADLYALLVVYLLQGVLAFLVAAPLPVGSFETGGLGVVGWLGLAVWAVGVFFEAVGDWQLERFRAEHRGQVMDRGLWRYTRHPNYFGDACVWWGLFLVTASSWPGVLTVLAPVLMTLLLTRGSGARIMEAHMRGRPGWDEYAARTSAFVPLPPRQ